MESQKEWRKMQKPINSYICLGHLLKTIEAFITTKMCGHGLFTFLFSMVSLEHKSN